MYYICKGEKVISSCDYFPNVDDLNSRGEFIIKDDRNMSVKDLICKDGKIVKVLRSKRQESPMIKEIKLLRRDMQMLNANILDLLDRLHGSSKLR